MRIKKILLKLRGKCVKSSEILPFYKILPAKNGSVCFIFAILYLKIKYFDNNNSLKMEVFS
jgi:hypothetical protein